MERKSSTSPESFAGFSPKEITRKRLPMPLDSPAVRISQPRTSKSRAALVWKKGRDFVEEMIKVEPADVNETIPSIKIENIENNDSLGRGKRMKKPKTIDSDQELEKEETDSIKKKKNSITSMKSKIKENHNSLKANSEELENDNLPSTSSNKTSNHKPDNLKKSNIRKRIFKKKSFKNGFKCDQCGRKYKYLRGMRQHKKLECNKEPQFPCPYCPSRFRYRQNIREHVRNYHEQAFPKWYATHYVVPVFL